MMKDGIRKVKSEEGETNVFRESKEAILSISTPERCRLERTKMRFS